MTAPAWIVGYRGIISVGAAYDGGGPIAVLIPMAQYATPLAVAQALASSCQAAVGGTWLATIDTTWTITIGVSSGHTCEVTWSDTDARDYLGYAGNLSPAAQTHTAPAAPSDVWLPGQYIHDIQEAVSSVCQWARSYSAADAVAPRRTRERHDVTWRIVLDDPEDLTDLETAVTWFHSAMSSELVGYVPETTDPTTYTTYLVDPEVDTVTMTDTGEGQPGQVWSWSLTLVRP